VFRYGSVPSVCVTLFGPSAETGAPYRSALRVFPQPAGPSDAPSYGIGTGGSWCGSCSDSFRRRTERLGIAWLYADNQNQGDREMATSVTRAVKISVNQLRKSVILFSIACAMVAIGAGSSISAATAPGDVGAGLFVVNGGSLVDSGTRLGPSDPGGADFFGSNVAIEGDLAVIGAANADDGVGAAYVFERKNGVWVERTKLVPTDSPGTSEFGENVRISGNTIAIGAPNDRNGKGSVYIFQKTGNVWTQQAKLTANDETVDSFFGDSIALRDDVLVSGAELGFVPGGVEGRVEAGAAYVFRRIGKSWTQEAKLIASDPIDQANFGSGTAIVSDNTIAIGAASARESSASSTRRSTWRCPNGWRTTSLISTTTSGRSRCRRRGAWRTCSRASGRSSQPRSTAVVPSGKPMTRAASSTAARPCS